MHTPTLPSITSKFAIPRPRQFVPRISIFQSLHHIISKIGRKHKAHRQQLAQGKPWRETEKGRGKGKDKSKGKGRHSRMGNEESRVVDPDTPPQTLKARTVEALAQYIKDGRAKQIVVMVSSPAYITSSHSSPTQDRRRHQYIRRHTRLQITRDGTIRQSRAPEPPIRRSRLRHLVF
jgi:hypothetical protein